MRDVCVVGAAADGNEQSEQQTGLLSPGRHD
jgi:hypothetical protein